MKRTSALGLAALAVIAGGGGFIVDQLLTAGGHPSFTPSTVLPLILVALAVAVVAAAIPVRRATRGTSPIDPFRALRIAMLAKASSIVGAVVAGFAGGLLVFVLTRPVSPSLGSTGAVIAALLSGVVLVAAALFAEYLCTIRKDDDDEQPGPDEPGLGLSHLD